MLFSPFDALGIPYSLKEYGAKELRRAYNAAMLVCHPDKRPRLGIPLARWPEARHVADAYNYMITPPKGARPLEDFEAFPRTFLPSKEAATWHQPPDEDVPGSIAQCSVCLAFVFRDSLLEHVEYEHRDIGNGKHLAEAEGLQFCRPCSLAMTSAGAHASHMEACHKCPVCEASEGSLLDHLEATHGLARCDTCNYNLYGELAKHVVVEHPVSGCPICSMVVFQSGMLSHMEQEHMFQACEGCQRWEIDSPGFQQHCEDQHRSWCQVCNMFVWDGGLIGGHLIRSHGIQTCALCPSDKFFDMDHILAEHAMELCGVCLVPYEKSRLTTHLRFVHDWLVCGVCLSAEPDEGALQAHQLEHTTCNVCQQLVAGDKYRQHLEDSHALLSCPLCDGNFAKGELPAHFEGSHPLLKPCAVCQRPQAEMDMGAHLEEAHQWVACALCSGMMSEAGQGSVDGRGSRAGRRAAQGLGATSIGTSDHIPSTNESHERGIQAHNLPLCLLCCRLSTQLLTQPLQDKHQPHPAIPSPRSSSGSPPGRETPDGSATVHVPEAQPRNDHVESTHLRRAREPVQQKAVGSDGETVEQHTATTVATAATAATATTARPGRPPPAQAHREAGPLAEARPAGACESRVPPGGGRASRRATREARMAATATATATAPSRAHAQTASSSTPLRRARARCVALRELQMELTGKDIIRRFADMVYSDSDKMRLKPAYLAARGDGQDLFVFVSQLSMFADTCETVAGFAKVCYYSGLVQMARELDRSREQSARLRTDSAEYNKILDLKGLKRTKEATMKLRNQVALGRKLARLCGPYQGLLCFLALSDRGVGSSLGFAKDDLETFHSRLSHFADRWAAGQKYMECITTGTDWETLQADLSTRRIR